MKRSVSTLLGLTQSFFQQYLQHTRGASRHTLRAYRDTLRLFFTFLGQQTHRGIDRLTLADVTVQGVLDFLVYLESQRGNRPITRNCRLAALHSWVKHLLRHDPASADQYARILALPTKRCRHQALPDYLEPEQFRLVLDEVPPQDGRGMRDAALLLFLYNTGARVSEALQLRWSDLATEGPGQVRLHGKGGRDRLCPLWKQTTRLLRQLRQRSAAGPEGFVFLNLRGQPLTRDGVAYVLRRCYRRAQQRHPSLPKFSIHPHLLRHSCAVALLQAGIELTVIRDYLGHATIASTSRYLQSNLAMKEEVLRRFWKRAGLDPEEPKRWRPSASLLRFLQSL
jgi:site-specific recombinase XerD